MSNSGDVSLGVWVGLFMTMTEQLIKEFIESVILETREEDLAKIKVANQSYNDILSYIKGLGRDTQNFARVFQTSNGYFSGFALGSRIRQEEHIKLSVFFLDRALFGVKGTVNAQAVRVKAEPTNPRSARLKGYQIYIYFDAPQEFKRSAKSYNAWLAQNLEDLLNTRALRSSYTHEFIHVLDFRRMDPKFLLQRTNNKQQQLDKQQATGEPKDFEQYVNDPLELNAYFSQAMADVRNRVRRAKTPEKRREILGTTAQEFVDKFMSKHLKPRLRKYLSPENRQRLMKRAATSWELLNQIK